MRVAALTCLALLQCGRGIEVKEDAKEKSPGKTVNVTNLDTKPWVPLSTEDVFRPPVAVAEEATDRHAASPPRSPSPDHEAYVQQEIERALQKLRAKKHAKGRSRGGQHEEGDHPDEQPIKFVHEPEAHDGSEEFHEYLQAYLPHLTSAAAGLEETVGSYSQRPVHDTEESLRLYPHPHNSIHQVPHKAAGTHFDPDYTVGKGADYGEHLKLIQSHYRPHVAGDLGLHVEGLSHEPPRFGGGVEAAGLAGAGHGSWSHLPPVPHKGSPHPYPFHGSLEPSAVLHAGLSPPPAIKSYHSHRGHTMGLLKKALNMLAAFIPLGLFLAALTPNVININTTNPDTSHRQRSNDAAMQYDLASYPIFGLIEDYGYDSLNEPDCENRIFCEMSRLGSRPNGNAIQKGFWELVHNTPEGMAESLGLKDVFKAVRTGSCDAFMCEKKDQAVGEAGKDDAADPKRKTREEKEKEEHRAEKTR